MSRFQRSVVVVAASDRLPSAAHAQPHPPLSCCDAHDEHHHLASSPVSRQLACFAGISIVQRGVPTPVAPTAFAMTHGLSAMLEESASGAGGRRPELTISALKLCRAHTAGLCKMAAACRNIHLCRAVALRETAAAPVTLPPIVPKIAGVAATEFAAAAATEAVRDSTDELPPLPAAAPFVAMPPPTVSSSFVRKTPRSASPTPPPATANSSTSSSSGAIFARFVRRWNQLADSQPTSVDAPRLVARPPPQPPSSAASSKQCLGSCDAVAAPSTVRVRKLLSALCGGAGDSGVPQRPTTADSDCVLIGDDDTFSIVVM